MIEKKQQQRHRWTLSEPDWNERYPIIMAISKKGWDRNAIRCWGGRSREMCDVDGAGKVPRSIEIEIEDE